MSKYLRLLKDRNILLLWSGLVISALGGSIRELAIIWFVLQTTGSALQIGAVLISSLLPIFLFTLGGEIADRYSRKRIIVIIEVIKVFLVLLYPVLSLMRVLELYHFYIIGFLVSACLILSTIARQAELPNLVSSEELVTLNALFRMSQSVVSILGTAIAGVIVGTMGLYALFLTVFAYSICAVLFFFMRTSAKDSMRSVTNSGKLRAGLLEGWQYIFHNRVLRSLSILSILFSLALPFGILIPKLAEVAGMGASGYGFLQSAKSVGNLLGSLSCGGIKLKASRSITGATAILGLFILLISLFLSPAGKIADSRAPEIFLLFFFMIGFTGMFVDIPVETLEQSLTPDNKRGKVLGAANTIDTLGNIPALLFMGALADFSLSAAFLLGSSLVLLGSIYSRFGALWHSENRSSATGQ